jgi:N6-adenosine-specific RNA methylase IME4
MAERKYNIIYADPPWHYNARNNAGTRFSRGVHSHYPTMSVDDICCLPINNIADKNCALILWVTFPRLKEGIQVMEAWGFRYVTVAFNWFKTNKNGSPFFGIGYYSKSNSEIALLGIKGKMKPASNFVSQVVVSQRMEHSKKPDIVRNKIVELFGELPRVELFARQKTSGWDVWGNEVEPDISMISENTV